MIKKIRLLIVDDSKAMQQIYIRSLETAQDIEVIGTAGDPYEAREKIFDLKPDVLTLDIEMPRMDGLTFLHKLMEHHPLPVVIISSLTTANSEVTIQALKYGAMEVMPKPDSAEKIGDFGRRLLFKVRAVANASFSRGAQIMPLPQQLNFLPRDNQILAIGASTGGIDAILQVVSTLPANTPGTVITQHLPKTFTPAFARMLKEKSALDVREAQGGEVLQPGKAYLAPGGRHLMIKKQVEKYVTQVKSGPDVCYQQPSVDVLFASVAKMCPGNSVGVLLTGMGNDGAQGLLAMKAAGCFTIAQDESTCVVYGMPKVAAELNAATEVLPLGIISRRILAGFERH